jgi:chromosome segregation ATPase
LRDRFFTPPVARAVTSPGGILLAGAGAAVGIVAGLPIIAAAAVGAAAWAARVAFAIPRNPSQEHIDPFTLQDPWRRFVSDALDARRQFDEAVRRAKTGPLRDRLSEIADRVATGVGESWRIACAGQALTDARGHIDAGDITRQLTELGLPPGAEPAEGSPLAGTVQALEAQRDTARRMDGVITETRDQLRLLDARLDEAVTRAIELSVRAQGTEDLGSLSQDVDTLVGEMESLRQALDETDTPALPKTALPRPAPPAPDEGTPMSGTA